MNTPSDPMTSLLTAAYITPQPPPTFVESLLADLRHEFASGGTTRWRAGLVLGGALAAGIILAAVCLAPLLRTRSSEPVVAEAVTPQVPAAMPTRPSTPTAAEAVTPPAPALMPTVGAGFGGSNPAMQIGQADWVVLVHVVSWKDALVDYKVDRVIYGELGDPLIRIDQGPYVRSQKPRMRQRLAELGQHDVSDAALTEAILADNHVARGEKAILYLSPPAKQDEGIRLFRYTGEAYDMPPNHRIEDVENEIVKLIAEGKNLELWPGPALTTAANAADLVVRAELDQLGDEQSRWKVLGTIKGQAKAQFVVVDHWLWHLRAQTIIRCQPGADRLSEQELTARINAEASRLVHAELSPGKRAILFLGDVRFEGDLGRGGLRRLILEDASGKRLDQMEEAIRHPSSIQGF